MNKQRGFSAVEAFILLIVLLLLGLAGWYVWSANNQETEPELQPTTSESAETTEPAVADTASEAETDPFADWNTYTDPTFGYSVKYPTDWLIADGLEFCAEGLVLLAPTEASLGRCASESGGEVMYSAVNGDQRSNYTFDSAYFRDITEEAATVHGVAGLRQSAVANSPDGEEFIDVFPDGTLTVRYVVYDDGVTYIATYTQRPTYPDALADFDLAVAQTFTW